MGDGRMIDEHWKRYYVADGLVVPPVDGFLVVYFVLRQQRLRRDVDDGVGTCLLRVLAKFDGLPGVDLRFFQREDRSRNTQDR